MIAFLVSAAGLTALALLLLLRPVRRGGAGPDDIRAPAARDVHRRVYRDQLAELRRDLAAGVIGAEEAAVAEIELQRRLLEDVAGDVAGDTAGDTAGDKAGTASRTTAWALALAIPLLGALGYAWRGHPEALPANASSAGVAASADAAAGTASAAPAQAAEERIGAMVERLAARLKEHPDDPAGWTRLARAWRVMGRAPEARAAYEHVGPALQQDPTLLAEYADTIAAMNGGRLDADAARALHRALALDPDHPMALSLAATAAFNAKDMDEAARQWTHLLKVLPPDSRDAAMARAYLAQTGRAASSAGAASGARR